MHLIKLNKLIGRVPKPQRNFGVNPLTFIAFALFVSACGGEDVAVVDLVRRGTVRIEAEGKFRAPLAEVQTVSQGSGFFIDAGGYIVTNNHVVGGSSVRKVYVDGEDKPFDAKLVAISECSDLAVIKIDDTEHEGVPLKWHNGSIEPGTEVYSSGFPGSNDGAYSLTTGIVSTASKALDTPWASVKEAVFHDAAINSGNSGGPLVIRDTGAVVGINYAGRSAENVNIAISADEAQRIVETLLKGNDVNSIGVSAQVIFKDANADKLIPLGIWVSSVRPGSVADKTGVKAGDVIVEIGGINVADSQDPRNASLFNFCEVLRSNDPATENIPIKVVRYDSLQVCEGQLNGKTLKATLSDGNEVECGAENPKAIALDSINDTSPSAEQPTTIPTDDTATDTDREGACLEERVAYIEIEDTYFLREGRFEDGVSTLGECMESIDDSWGEFGYVFELGTSSYVAIYFDSWAPLNSVTLTLVNIDNEESVSVKNDKQSWSTNDMTSATYKELLPAGAYMLVIDAEASADGYQYYLDISAGSDG